MDNNVGRTKAILIENSEKVVGRRVVVDETDPASAVLLTFPKTIQRFRETNAVARVTLNGELIRETSEHSDYYGFFTSFDEPLESAMKWRKKFPSPMMVELVIETSEFYALPHTPDEYQAGWNVQWYRAIPRDWMDVSTEEQMVLAKTWADEKDWTVQFELPKPHRFDTTSTREVVWSSNMSDEGGLAAIRGFIERVSDGHIPHGEDANWIEDRMSQVRKHFEVA